MLPYRQVSKGHIVSVLLPFHYETGFWAAIFIPSSNKCTAKSTILPKKQDQHRSLPVMLFSANTPPPRKNSTDLLLSIQSDIVGPMSIPHAFCIKRKNASSQNALLKDRIKLPFAILCYYPLLKSNTAC